MRSSRALGSNETLVTGVGFAAIKAIAAVDLQSGVGRNSSRTALSVFNDTDQPVYVFFKDDLPGIQAGTVKPTVKVGSGQYYEDPANWQGWVVIAQAPLTPGGTPTAPTLGTVNITEWL